MSSDADRRVTRLAPSPTGALHLGNVRTFLINWAVARQSGWLIRMRVEDLDGPRVKPGAETEAIELLQWLGIDWDGSILRQSDDLRAYRDAMRQLASMRLVYPCALSRREIEQAASAPHAGEHESRYPASLRPRDRPTTFDDESTNWRFVVPEGVTRFHDEVAGPQSRDLAESIGDFVVWTRRGEPSYQLAVIVDDARQGVTDIVRGDDLLDSAARQIRLIEALGLGPAPRYFHLPLVVGEDGRRLAKRHGDTRVRTYREAGVTAEGIIGLVANWSGVTDRPRAMSAAEWAERFTLNNLPRTPITFTAKDDAWLRSASE